MSAVYDTAIEADPAQAMIDWLRGKSPDVWHMVADELNWDTSRPVLDWIVSQRQCDRATAALIFWGANPLYHARTLGTGEKRNDAGLWLVAKVLRNWKSGFYTRAELASEEDHRADYKVARYAMGGTDPLAIPAELLAPWKGRKLAVPEPDRPENNFELYELFQSLDVQLANKPGTDWQRSERTRARTKFWREQKEAALYLLSFVPWIVAFGIVAAGGAFLVRYANTGQLLF